MSDRWATSGSHPVLAARRAAELVAALDRDEPSPAEVRAVLAAHGEPPTSEPTGSDLARLRAPARELREVFAATDTGQAAAALNGILRRHAHRPRLTSHDHTTWHLHVDSHDDADWVEWFATSSALALAILLAERQEPPGGLCAAPGCGRPFVPSGSGGARRYCSARCATRVRVARHRATDPTHPVRRP